MSTKLISYRLDKNLATDFVADIGTIPHYVALSKCTSFLPDDQTLPTAVETQQTSVANVYNDMLFGKRITASDASLMVKRHDWQSDTVFEMYTGDSNTLLTTNFYASVNAGSFYHVYKCLDNNKGANSTVQPSGQDITPFTTPSDGYTWKYMFSVPSSTFSKFSTTDFMPIVANTAIQAAAVEGSIDIITVESAGSGYNNYVLGTLRAQDVAVGGENTLFGLPDTASALTGYYQNCIIKMTSGAANNQYRNIIAYSLINGQKVITLDSGFDNAPVASDTYEVYPAVAITGDGKETDTCVARAIINPNAANSVSAVEVLHSGSGYRKATADIFPHPSVGVSLNASLLPIISPAGGHGSDPASELGATYAAISIRLTGSESNNIPTANDYRQVSIIKNPLFANVDIVVDGSSLSGSFTPGEEVANFRSIPLAGTVKVANNNSSVIGTGTSFTTSIGVGDTVLVDNGAAQFLANVFYIADDLTLNLDANVTFSSNSSTLSRVRVVGTGTFGSLNSSNLVLTDCSALFTTTAKQIVGRSSSAKVSMNTTPTHVITINGNDVGNFTYFTQLTKITGTLNSGVFQNDEVVVQGANTYTATLFSYTANTTSYIYVNNEVGTFDANSQLIGQSSGAIFTPANKYPGALKVDSGEILYFENISPITRDSTKSETIKIILEF